MNISVCFLLKFPSSLSHVCICIVIHSTYYIYLPWYRWQRWLWMLSLLLRSRDQESQKNVGRVCGRAIRAFLTTRRISYSCWRLNWKISIPHHGWAYARKVDLQQRFPRSKRCCSSVSHDTGSVVLRFDVASSGSRVLQIEESTVTHSGQMIRPASVMLMDSSLEAEEIRPSDNLVFWWFDSPKLCGVFFAASFAVRSRYSASRWFMSRKCTEGSIGWQSARGWFLFWWRGTDSWRFDARSFGT